MKLILCYKNKDQIIMIRVVKAKLKSVRDENRTAMMTGSYDGCVAAGRFACSCLLLSGSTPAEAEAGLGCLPGDSPQVAGWLEVIKQFTGLIE